MKNLSSCFLLRLDSLNLIPRNVGVVFFLSCKVSRRKWYIIFNKIFVWPASFNRIISVRKSQFLCTVVKSEETKRKMSMYLALSRSHPVVGLLQMINSNIFDRLYYLQLPIWIKCSKWRNTWDSFAFVFSTVLWHWRNINISFSFYRPIIHFKP